MFSLLLMLWIALAVAVVIAVVVTVVLLVRRRQRRWSHEQALAVAQQHYLTPPGQPAPDPAASTVDPSAQQWQAPYEGQGPPPPR